ncbi:MAG: hypothetical protein ACRCWF_08605 [Beijerinckiaceae bacterium]
MKPSTGVIDPKPDGHDIGVKQGEKVAEMGNRKGNSFVIGTCGLKATALKCEKPRP